MVKNGKVRQKQGPPVTFRPGPELEQLVAGFAAARGSKPNETFKNLAALAAVGLDGRHYDLIAALAGRAGGPNPFVRAALRVHAGLLAAARVDPRYASEPARTAFVIDTVGAQVAAAGGGLDAAFMHALLVRLGLPASGTAGIEGASEESQFHSTEYGRAEPQKVRITGG